MGDHVIIPCMTAFELLARVPATLDAARSTGEELDVERLARALDMPGVFEHPLDDAIGLAHDIDALYAALRSEDDG